MKSPPGAGQSLQTVSETAARPLDLRRKKPTTIALRIIPAAERAIRAGHPWLFSKAIRQQSHEGQPGDLAVIFDRKGRFLAVGLYDPESFIRVRVLQAGQPALIDQAWFRDKLNAAASRRAPLPETGTDGYRLVHGENDGLPGLVVDRYAETLVIKLYTTAWIPHLWDAMAALTTIQPAQRLVLRLSRAVQARPQHLDGLRDGQILQGLPLAGLLLFKENGLLFEADPVQGHKTGFYLDQRENRARVEKLAAGRRILNVFAYTGGFSLYAARGGAEQITSVDISGPALETAARNFALNRQNPAVAAARHVLVEADAFAALADFGRQKRQFDLVILDPPSFAKKKAQIPGALAAYRHLTRLGLAVLAADGALVQASCSSQISAADFFAAVHQAAQEAGRPLREIERSGHPPDHPVGFSEGAYLKCLFAQAG